MPLIHRENGNFYRPGKPLQHLFGAVVLRPLRRELPDLADRLRDQTVMQRVREDVLDRGCTDFCQPYEGPSPVNTRQVVYSPARKVLLYSALYMPMHLYSSYHVYRRYLEPPEGKVLFIDFGCGPLTSGVAYRAFAKHADIDYIGIDRSEAMLKKAEEVNTRGLSNRDRIYHPNRNRIYRHCWLMESWERLRLYLDCCILRGDQTEIVFNFCYFLASPSLDVNNLIGALSPIMERYEKHPMRVLYQNPPVERLRHNWNVLKSCLMHGFQPSELNRDNRPKTELFTYPRLTDENLHRDVRVECETLYKPPA